MLTRKQKLSRRRVLARLLIARGVKPPAAHSDVGFMLNRAPVEKVEAAILASLLDDDPIAAAMERLAVDHA